MADIVLQARETVTIWGDKSVQFEGDWATVRVLDTLYRVENDDGNFIWNSLSNPGTNTPRLEFEQGEDEGLSFDFGTPKLPYRVTWVGYTEAATPYHTFGVEILDTYNCVRGNIRLPADLAAELVEPVNVANADPNKPWANFNALHRQYRIYKQFAIFDNLICAGDLPDEPQVEEYD